MGLLFLEGDVADAPSAEQPFELEEHQTDVCPNPI